MLNIVSKRYNSINIKMSKPSVYSIIVGSGSYLPEVIMRNEDFLHHTFYDPCKQKIAKTNEFIINKFHQITGISERRYVRPDQVASDIATEAAIEAIADAKIDAETLDCLIVAHNFGDVTLASGQSDCVPSLAARVKYKLQILNPQLIAFDLPFGCAGWLQAVIQANQFIQAGIYKRVLVIGAETISRVSDPHDRDSMIYADGAGAVILEAKESEFPIGILKQQAKSLAYPHALALRMEKSYNPDATTENLFLKMDGHKLYEQVITHVPQIMKECIEASPIEIADIDTFLIHQANLKMDEAILSRLFEAYQIKPAPLEKMPMSISFLGNSSVATIPTLYDLIAKGKFEGHQFKSGQHIMFAAVGAGINLNAVIYRIP